MRRILFRSTVLNSLVVTLILTSAALLEAETIQVPAQFPTIQDAVDAASDGDIIELSIGVFKGDGNRDVRLDGKAITIRGIFGAEFTMVDAEGTSEEPYRGFIFDSGETTDTVIEGLTICGGATLPGAVLDEFNGGGLFFFNSSATVKNCIIDNNECGCWGAGVYVTGDSAPVLVNCSVSENYSGDDGGGVFIWNGGCVTMINCNINNNEARVTGGAITDFSSSQNRQSRLINCNVVGNQAFFGSAIYGWNMEIVNTIIWGNQGADDAVEGGGSSIIVTHSIVQGGFEGAGNIDGSPFFVNASNGDYRLSSGSPAIDAADNGAIPFDITTDIFGNTRFHDDVGMADAGNAAGQSAVADLGPTEFLGRTVSRFRKAFGN